MQLCLFHTCSISTKVIPVHVPTRNKSTLVQIDYSGINVERTIEQIAIKKDG